MQDNLSVNDTLDEPVVDGAFIESDLGISSRTRRTYGKGGILPPPDANLLGRNIWKLSTYRKFKADLLAGRFALLRRLPHLQGGGGAVEHDAVSNVATMTLTKLNESPLVLRKARRRKSKAA